MHTAFPYIQKYFNSIMRYHTWHAIFKSSSLTIRLNCFLGLHALLIYCQSKTCDPCLHNNWPGTQHRLQHQIIFGNMWKPHGLLYPKKHPMPLWLYAESSGSGYSQQCRHINDWFSHYRHIVRSCNFNRLVFVPPKKLSLRYLWSFLMMHFL